MLLAIVLFTMPAGSTSISSGRLYVNQLVNAAVKVYMLWRLAKQKWANRGNQKQGFSGPGWRGACSARSWRHVLTALSFAGLFLIVMIYTKLADCPELGLCQQPCLKS